MNISNLDWGIIIGVMLLSLLIGLLASRKAGKSSSDFFLSGRNMPWWLLGISMVATTFSADTPNLVTDIVRKNGVGGNWVWWAYLLTGMLTVFIYSKLWRRTQVLTDLEFYELRYSGPIAKLLRGFRALYLGVVFNVLVLGTVCVAAIKISSILLGLEPLETILIASIVTVIYSVLGGLRGVILTDLFQFALAMIGSVWACIVIIDIPEIQSIDNLLDHSLVIGKLDLIPDLSDPSVFLGAFLLPISILWWASWYPGSEPGGGGYVAQRMLAAKDEKNAVGATLLFNIAHYALRPWPWILIALASLIVVPMSISEKTLDQVKIAPEAHEILANVPFTNVQKALNHELEINPDDPMLLSIVNCLQKDPQAMQIKALAYLYNDEISAKKEGDSALPKLKDSYEKINLFLASPNTPIDKIGQDNAYSIMLMYLPKGLIGLVLASLIAAFMSTLSSHLNWGASYISHDFYHRFINPNASEKQLVNIGRISTVVLMILAAIIALALESALEAFSYIVMLGAGTGLVFILRWFWNRINAYTEMAAMLISLVVALMIKIIDPDISKEVLVLVGVGLTTAGWLLVTLLSPKEDSETLKRFDALLSSEFGNHRKKLGLPIAMMLIGSIGIYCLLFCTGYMIYGELLKSGICLLVALISSIFIYKNWRKVIEN
ncbi:MAG: sodium:solute symporter family protein [Bacteroidota bacterium]